jgi:hypothetical protein
MNGTVVFLKPSLRFGMEEVAYEGGNLAERRSDIVIGTVPIIISLSKLIGGVIEVNKYAAAGGVQAFLVVVFGRSL